MINGKEIDAIKITARKKKKKQLYSWEMDEEPEEAKVLKMRSRKPLATLGEGSYGPCEDENGWYVKEGAQPEDHWVDFRVIMTEAELNELEVRRRRWFQEQKHKER